MRKVIVCFMILSLTCLVYAESGFLLDKLPFKKGKAKQIKKDEEPEKKIDKSGAELPKPEIRAVPGRELPALQKKAMPQSKPATKQSLQRVIPGTELSKPADNYILIQKQIALQQKKNELAQLEQQLLKIQCEKEKIKLEIESLKNPNTETKTSKPTYVSGITGIKQGTTQQSFFRALMVSSVDGMRALILDGGVTYYTHKGEKVSKGTVQNITSEGVYLDEEGETVFYPVSH